MNGGAGLSRRSILIGVLLAVAMTALPAIAGSVPGPGIEAVNEGSGIYGTRHHWSPAQVSVGAGAAVSLANPTAVAHGVEWRAGPETPVCSGTVPVGTAPAASASKWAGSCTFTKPGLYTFYCTVHGPEMTGTVTVPGTPTAQTDAPAPVAQTEATLAGAVKPEGNATSYHFEYGTTAAFGQVSSEASAGADFAVHHVSLALTGLAPDTEYHAELIAVYGAGATKLEGGEITFKTAPVAAPGATTAQAASVGETAATLTGTVSPEGLQTTYFFKYGLSESYEHATATESTGPAGVNHAVLASLTGLSPDTVYHYRLFAMNSLDPSAPVEGEDRTFTTAAPPPPSPPPPAPAPAPTPAPTVPGAAPLAIAPVLQLPLEGGLPFAAKFASSQRGELVRGAVTVSPAGAGGRLEVTLLAAKASLARAGRSTDVRVGELSRSSLRAGKLRFAVPLTARAKSALRRHRRLALTVRIVLTRLHGPATTVSRNVVLHG